MFLSRSWIPGREEKLSPPSILTFVLRRNNKKLPQAIIWLGVTSTSLQTETMSATLFS